MVKNVQDFLSADSVLPKLLIAYNRYRIRGGGGAHLRQPHAGRGLPADDPAASDQERLGSPLLLPPSPLP